MAFGIFVVEILTKHHERMFFISSRSNLFCIQATSVYGYCWILYDMRGTGSGSPHIIVKVQHVLFSLGKLCFKYFLCVDMDRDRSDNANKVNTQYSIYVYYKKIKNLCSNFL